MSENTDQIRRERDQLRRGAAALGDSLKFWMDLAVDVTNSHDLIGEDGDGDWMAVAERLAAMKPTEGDPWRCAKCGYGREGHLPGQRQSDCTWEPRA